MAAFHVGFMEKMAKLKLEKGQAGAASQFSHGHRPGVSRILTWCYLEEDFEECLHICVYVYPRSRGRAICEHTAVCVRVCVCATEVQETECESRGRGKGEMWRERVKSCLVKRRRRRCQGAKRERRAVEEWGENRRWSGGACHSESRACLLFNRQ